MSSSSKTKPETAGTLADGGNDVAQETDSSGLFLVTEPFQTTQGMPNAKLQCIRCGANGFCTYYSRRAHILERHSELLSTFETAVQPRTSKSGLAADGREPDYLHGTRQNVLRMIAIFLLTSRLPLRTIQGLAFRNMLRVVHNLATNKEKLEFCSRENLLDTIEGEDGLLQDCVESQRVKHLRAAQLTGSSLSFGGANDVCSVSTEVFTIQTTAGSSLAFAAPFQANSKTVDWTFRQLNGILRGEIDYDRMEASAAKDGEEEVAGTTDVFPKGSSNGPEANQVKRMRLYKNLTGTLQLSEFVWSAGGDNSRIPVGAVCQLEKDEGIVPFSDVSHSFNGSFLRLMKLSPFDKVIDAASKICEVFMSHHLPQALLKNASKTKRMLPDGSYEVNENIEKKLVRLVEKRFISVSIMLARQLDLRRALEVVVVSTEFKIWRSKQSVTLGKTVDEVIGFIRSESHWLSVEFVNQISIGYVVAIRLFDGVVPGAACIVNKVWSMLASTIGKIMCDPKFAKLVSRELFDSIRAAVEDDWGRFHYPVFAAAYLGCVAQRDEIVDLMQSDAPYFCELKDQTKQVMQTFFRRFNSEGNRRQSVLDQDDKAVLDCVEKCMVEFEDYVWATGIFTTVEFRSKRSPVDWWVHRAPPNSLLRTFYSRICALNPSSTGVDRLQKLFKSVPTKQRNHLRYARAFGFTFVASEWSSQETTASVARLSLSNYGDRFTSLNRFDKDYLISLTEVVPGSQEGVGDGISTILGSGHFAAFSEELADEGLDETPQTLILQPSFTVDIPSGIFESGPGSVKESPFPQSSSSRSAFEIAPTTPPMIPEFLISSRSRIVNRRIFDGYQMRRWGVSSG